MKPVKNLPHDAPKNTGPRGRNTKEEEEDFQILMESLHQELTKTKGLQMNQPAKPNCHTPTAMTASEASTHSDTSACKTRKNREWREDVQGPKSKSIPQIIVTDPEQRKWRMLANIRSQGPLDMATVARTVGRKEMMEQKGAQDSLAEEWKKLRNIGGKEGNSAWDEAGVRNWHEVLNECVNLDNLHIGSLHELCVEKGSELDDGNPGESTKGT